MSNILKGKLVVKGERGYSAYEIAVKNGFEGTEEEWLESLIGSIKIENVDENVSELVSYIILQAGTTIVDGFEITLENSYIVGNNELKVFWNGVLLKKATSTEDGHYKEIGESEKLSNKIQICRTEDDGDYTLTENVVITAITKNNSYSIEETEEVT